VNLGQKEILNLVRLPGRSDIEMVAALTGYQPHDVRVLVAAGLLKPMSNPAPSCAKYFYTPEVLEKAADRKWQAKATACTYAHWRSANARRLKKQTSNQTSNS
jgi:hypothetical protein